ncbi:hypothetical protein [Lichenibacterium ramalinae]|uniref:Uncharacterized protein n=1 Tax=Lichenibacterium ramalinae TaxID=2316527 RepID=A0A4Q2RDH8_9HYPH|nr:hypothetical protein [Lichenibacterium ramalinae]RYB04393.1 hypothetical protein D3272_13160 [Lichenibacterium ramalinae]
MGAYADFAGISDESLRMRGFELIAEDDFVKLYMSEVGPQIVSKEDASRFLWIEDDHDLALHPRTTLRMAPPW